MHIPLIIWTCRSFSLWFDCSAKMFRHATQGQYHWHDWWFVWTGEVKDAATYSPIDSFEAENLTRNRHLTSMQRKNLWHFKQENCWPNQTDSVASTEPSSWQCRFDVSFPHHKSRGFSRKQREISLYTFVLSYYWRRAMWAQQTVWYGQRWSGWEAHLVHGIFVRFFLGVAAH